MSQSRDILTKNNNINKTQNNVHSYDPVYGNKIVSNM